MSQTIRVGETTFTLDIADNHLRSLGGIAVGNTPLRNPSNSFLPWFDTYEGDIFRRFRLEGIDQKDNETLIRTTALSDPDTLFQERRDCSGDPCLRTTAWGAEPLEAALDIHLAPAEAEFDGHAFTGFRYWFCYRGDETKVHRFTDRQTWEVGGDLSDLNVVCRGLFDQPRKRVTLDSGCSSVGLDNWAALLPGNLWARWSLLPAFDMQYGQAGCLLGWFDRVSLIRSVIESMPGEDWVRYLDLHYFENTTAFATNPKSVLFCPDLLDHTDALNLWTRVYDQEQEKAQQQFGIDYEEPPAITNSINVWRGFTFAETYDDAIDTAAELGMDYVFIDPVWQNLETFNRRLKEELGDRRQDGVFGKYEEGNMCCTMDFEVSEVAGGEEGLKTLCDRAAAKGVKLISWMSTHYTPQSQLAFDKELGHGMAATIAAKESGRHPDTGYASACWTVNLNAPIYQKIREQVLGVCERTGLKGFLWDSFSNLGWWQIDYSAGTMRPQWDKMAELYKDLTNAGLYIQPEAVVSFSNHSCCGLHGGNIYAGDLLGYSYNSVIGLKYKNQETGEWVKAGAEYVITGEAPVDELFRCFAHKRVPACGFFQVPREQWDPAGVQALKDLYSSYRQVRGLMRKRTVLKDDAGVIWENDEGTPVLWPFAKKTWPQRCTEVLTGEETDLLKPNRVYLVTG